MKLTDFMLARRLRRRDRDACHELIRRHHATVYGYLRGMGADAAAADDLTQEAYAKAWQKLDRLRDAASARSWLLTIARNDLLQWARRRRPDFVGDEALAELEATDRSADERIEHGERDRLLAELVDGLDSTLREVVVLHYFQGLSLRETAKVQDVPLGTAKSRLNRALAELRGQIQEGEDEEPQPKAARETSARPA